MLVNKLVKLSIMLSTFTHDHEPRNNFENNRNVLDHRNVLGRRNFWINQTLRSTITGFHQPHHRSNLKHMADVQILRETSLKQAWAGFEVTTLAFAGKCSYHCAIKTSCRVYEFCMLLEKDRVLFCQGWHIFLISMLESVLLHLC